MPKNQFTSERQPANRGRRGPDKRTLLLNALEEQSMDEQGFYRMMLARALDPKDSSSAVLIKEVAQRLYPLAKPVMPTVEFNFPSEGTAADRIDAIADGIAEGAVPADVGKAMVDIIKTSVDVREASELAERIEALEKALANGEKDPS